MQVQRKFFFGKLQFACGTKRRVEAAAHSFRSQIERNDKIKTITFSKLDERKKIEHYAKLFWFPMVEHHPVEIVQSKRLNHYFGVAKGLQFGS